MVASQLTGQKALAWVASPSAADLETLKNLLEAGTIRPVVDRTYPLDAVPEAIRYVEETHPQGKVAITVCPA